MWRDLVDAEQLEEEERRGGVARGRGEGDDEHRFDGVLQQGGIIYLLPTPVCSKVVGTTHFLPPSTVRG